MLQSDAVTLDVDAAVNATGIFSNVRKTDSALVAQFLADGCIQPGLFVVGTLRRGEELECTAVPEIRRQVADVVEKIARMTEEAAGGRRGNG